MLYFSYKRLYKDTNYLDLNFLKSNDISHINDTPYEEESQIFKFPNELLKPTYKYLSRFNTPKKYNQISYHIPKPHCKKLNKLRKLNLPPLEKSPIKSQVSININNNNNEYQSRSKFEELKKQLKTLDCDSSTNLIISQKEIVEKTQRNYLNNSIFTIPGSVKNNICDISIDNSEKIALNIKDFNNNNPSKIYTVLCNKNILFDNIKTLGNQYATNFYKSTISLKTDFEAMIWILFKINALINPKQICDIKMPLEICEENILRIFECALEYEITTIYEELLSFLKENIDLIEKCEKFSENITKFLSQNLTVFSVYVTKIVNRNRKNICKKSKFSKSDLLSKNGC